MSAPRAAATSARPTSCERPGRCEAVATLVLDIAKGFLAVWIAAMLTDDAPLWTSLAALAVMAGHAFPVFLQFKGGKAVASFIGAFLVLNAAFPWRSPCFCS